MSLARTIEVLLVEDNPGDVDLVRHSAELCDRPVTLHVANDGEEALRLLDHTTSAPDLVILDLNLPKVSGFDVLEQAQQHDLPFVIFSSSCNTAEIKRALELGARECVQKPTDVTAFVPPCAG